MPLHGRVGKVIAQDVDLSPFFNNVDLSFDVDAPDTTVFGNAGDRTFIAGGLRGGSISLSGFWDGATGGVDEEIATVLGNATARVISVSQAGFSVGDVVYLPNSIYTNYSVSQPVDGVVSLTADIQATGPLVRGLSLHNLTAETASTTGTTVDQSSSGAFGGGGHMHVTSSSGTSPTLDVTVEHATSSGGSYSTFLTFAQSTGRTAERIVSGSSLNRWVKIVATIGGSDPSFTFQVGFGKLLS